MNNRKLSGPQNDRRRSSSYNRFNANGDLRNESFEESEEYEYEENNRVNRKASSAKNYSAFGKDIDFTSGIGGGGGDGLSLGALKKPTINSWDSMGILGLSSKMFSDSTSKRYDNFFSSSTRGSSYLREDNYNIM